jgi:RNA polymerase sigma-70 factor (ECF subfamily)
MLREFSAGSRIEEDSTTNAETPRGAVENPNLPDSTMIEAHRTYLTIIAAELLRPEIRSKVSPSDLVQESMIVAYRKFESYRGKSLGELRNWLEGILRRKYCGVMKKYYRTEKSTIHKEKPIETLKAASVNWDLSASSDQTAGSIAEYAEIRELVYSEIDRLSPDERKLIDLKLRHQLTIAEIARRLDISTDCAHKRYQRTIKKLYDRVTQQT